MSGSIRSSPSEAQHEALRDEEGTLAGDAGGKSVENSRAALNANKRHFRVARLFETAESRLRAELTHLTRCEYPIGIWHVIGNCSNKRTNYFGVDVAREFPGSIAVLLFKCGASLIDADVVSQLRCKHESRSGASYYQNAQHDRHRVHTSFLIPSLDYWERHVGDFIALAATINDGI